MYRDTIRPLHPDSSLTVNHDDVHKEYISIYEEVWRFDESNEIANESSEQTYKMDSESNVHIQNNTPDLLGKM